MRIVLCLAIWAAGIIVFAFASVGMVDAGFVPRGYGPLASFLMCAPFGGYMAVRLFFPARQS